MATCSICRKPMLSEWPHTHSVRVVWSRDEMRTELDRFEDEYGVPSEQLAEAFRVGGELRETDDFRRWDFVYACWRQRG